jgi:hypothetical protein
MKPVPILIDHDKSYTIGNITLDGDDLIITIDADAKITREIFFDIFGNVGVEITDVVEGDDLYFITKAKIIEFSLSQSQSK